MSAMKAGISSSKCYDGGTTVRAGGRVLRE